MKWLSLFNLALVSALLFQIWAPTPELITLLQASDSPRQLHQPQATSRAFLSQIHRVGAYVNVEDIIRHLEGNPTQYSNPTLQAHLKKMQNTQQSLFETEQSLLQAEEELNRLAIELYMQLTPAQQKTLLSNRNFDSVQQIEKGYWDSLIESLDE